MRTGTSLLTSAVVSGVGLAGLLASASAQDQPPFGTDEDVAFAETLWNGLVEASLAGENAINTVPYEGAGRTD